MVDSQEMEEMCTASIILKSAQAKGRSDGDLEVSVLGNLHSPPQVSQTPMVSWGACNKERYEANEEFRNQDITLFLPRTPQPHLHAAPLNDTSLSANQDQPDCVTVAPTCSSEISHHRDRGVIARSQRFQEAARDHFPPCVFYSGRQDLQRFWANDEFKAFKSRLCQVQRPIQRTVSWKVYLAYEGEHINEAKQGTKYISTAHVTGSQDQLGGYERTYACHEPAPSHSPAVRLAHKEKCSDAPGPSSLSIPLPQDQPVRRSILNVAVSMALVMFIVSRVIFLQKDKKRLPEVETAETDSAFRMTNLTLLSIAEKAVIRPIVGSLKFNSSNSDAHVKNGRDQGRKADFAVKYSSTI